MFPLKGVYLFLVLTGSNSTYEQIELMKQTSMRECINNAEVYGRTGKYAVSTCIVDGAIMAPNLIQYQGATIMDNLLGTLQQLRIIPNE